MFLAYRKTQNPQGGAKIKDIGKAKVYAKSSCPSPKTFIEYTEGRIKGPEKNAIDRHIDHCKDCRDALNLMFGMSPGAGQK